jgi:hypothetical protein
VTPEIMHRIDASRARMVVFVERLHAERDPDCHVWEHWTIPAFGGERMAVEGCRTHDILISSREGNER